MGFLQKFRVRADGDRVKMAGCSLGYFILLLVVLLHLTGCATISPPESQVSGDCQELWQAMADAIDREGVGDGYSQPIKGFDYLRTERFLAGLGEQADTTRKERALLERMRMLDLHRRYQELEFLSDEAWRGFVASGYPSEEGVFKRQVASCSVDFMQADRQDPEYFNRVMAAIDLDQDYSTLYRTLGLYPLTHLVVNQQVKSYQKDHPVLLNTEMEGSTRIVEPVPGRKLSAGRLKVLLRNSRLRPFLDFQLTEQRLADLVHFYGPVFELAGDSFGRLVSQNGNGWQVDDSDPVVYYYLSQAMMQGVPALQINYVIWFNERREPAPWYTKGHLDGITVRVTLDWQGRPLVFDSIGNCGCFYFAAHNDSLLAEMDDHDGFKPHLIGSMPAVSMTNHFKVQVEGGSNLVVGLASAPLDADHSQYRLLPYEILERYSSTLPYKFFDDDGFVEDTDRFESYFLFPMGIPKVGAMRQRGRQPITLVGRSYFDDPHLFDSILVLKEAIPPLKKMVKKGKKTQSNLQRRVESSKAMSESGNSKKAKYFRRRGMGM